MLKYSLTVKLLTEHHLEFISLKGGCTGSLSLHLSKYHIVGSHVLEITCHGSFVHEGLKMMTDGSYVSLYVIVFSREIKALQEIEDNPYVSITVTELSCYLYVYVDALCPSQQFFSHVRTISSLFLLNQC